MAAVLGGPADLIAAPQRHLPQAPSQQPALPETGGFVAAIDVRALGLAVLALGGGRTRADQAIDHAVGLTEVAGLGEAVGPEQPLALVHARSEEEAEAAAAQLRAAFTIAGQASVSAPLVHERIVG